MLFDCVPINETMESFSRFTSLCVLDTFSPLVDTSVQMKAFVDQSSSSKGACDFWKSSVANSVLR